MTACLFCGNDVNPARADKLVYEDDERDCLDCGATLIVGVGEDPVDVDVGETELDVYWTSESRCRHGKPESEACALCESEDGTIVVGEVES